MVPALVRCAADEADFVLLVKPQFEAGREAVGAGAWCDRARIGAGRLSALPRPCREAGSRCGA